MPRLTAGISQLMKYCSASAMSCTDLQRWVMRSTQQMLLMLLQLTRDRSTTSKRNSLLQRRRREEEPGKSLRENCVRELPGRPNARYKKGCPVHAPGWNSVQVPIIRLMIRPSIGTSTDHQIIWSLTRLLLRTELHYCNFIK